MTKSSCGAGISNLPLSLRAPLRRCTKPSVHAHKRRHLLLLHAEVVNRHCVGPVIRSPHTETVFHGQVAPSVCDGWVLGMGVGVGLRNGGWLGFEFARNGFWNGWMGGFWVRAEWVKEWVDLIQTKGEYLWSLKGKKGGKFMMSFTSAVLFKKNSLLWSVCEAKK